MKLLSSHVVKLLILSDGKGGVINWTLGAGSVDWRYKTPKT
jgi:hypothetical protein